MSHCRKCLCFSHEPTLQASGDDQEQVATHDSSVEKEAEGEASAIAASLLEDVVPSSSCPSHDSPEKEERSFTWMLRTAHSSMGSYASGSSSSSSNYTASSTNEDFTTSKHEGGTFTILGKEESFDTLDKEESFNTLEEEESFNTQDEEECLNILQEEESFNLDYKDDSFHTQDEEECINILEEVESLNPQDEEECFKILEEEENFNTEDKEESFNILKVMDAKAAREKQRNKKVTDLVNYLIQKYKMKVPVTKLEMLKVVTNDFKKQFSEIFKEASICLEVIFGIDIKRNDCAHDSYKLVNSLNLTYEDEDLSDEDSMPTNGFLIVILGVIFMEGNCASEESIWNFLRVMGVHDGEEHFIYGDPRKHLTGDFVEQNYLEYQVVPNSYPPRYEFFWGPRAYAETTKMEVLEFLAKVTGRDPVSFFIWYEDAFRDHEGRVSNRNDPMPSAAVFSLAQHGKAADQGEESGLESASTLSKEES